MKGEEIQERPVIFMATAGHADALPAEESGNRRWFVVQPRQSGKTAERAQSILEAMLPNERARTSMENVLDVLNAVHRLQAR